MDHQSAIARAASDAVMEYAEGRDISDEMICNGLEDAAQDILCHRKRRDVFAKSEAEA